ncbi:signal recognition particle-docking protein FtsY [Candidatus Bathyarchaeota archaeon]|nr:signal recognition particle-docking protein FtsY [Candidatus Bathyarchaeota archaeon]
MSDFLDNFSKTEIKGKELERLLEEFKLLLVENDVAFEVAEHICQIMKEKIEKTQVSRFADRREMIRSTLREVLEDVLNSGGKVDIVERVQGKRGMGQPSVMIFLGINGTGKTTTIAKVANFLQKKGFSVVVACSDTYRTGSIEQLEMHAKRIGVKSIRHDYGADAAAVAFDTINYAKSHGIDVVLIDTAGRMQTDTNLMKEIEKIARVTNPDLTIFVGDSLAGNDAVSQANEFTRYVKIDGSILTKLDADAKGGSAISIAFITKKPVIFLGTGQSYDDLATFDPHSLVSRIIE